MLEAINFGLHIVSLIMIGMLTYKLLEFMDQVIKNFAEVVRNFTEIISQNSKILRKLDELSNSIDKFNDKKGN